MKPRKKSKPGLKTKGEGKRALVRLTALVLTIIVILLAYKLGPPYINYYRFKGELQQAIINARTRMMDEGIRSDGEIRKDTLEVAQKNNIILEGKNIQITRLSDNIEVSVEYTITVDFIIMKRDLIFRLKGSSYSL